jgi:tetratricopeptide (TPR) repeat protein
VRLGEVLRLQGRYAEAADQYLAAIERNPRALDGQITAIASGLRDPAQLTRLRDGYVAQLAENPDDVGLLALVGLLSDRAGDLRGAADAFGRVVQLQPDNLEARQNYTLVLSDMLEYQRAADEAQGLLDRARESQQVTEQDLGAIQALLEFLRARAAGG